MNMSNGIAHWIRVWVIQALITVTSGSRKVFRGGIGIVVQADIHVANWLQNILRDLPIVVILRFEDDLIPEGTELVLQFR